MIDFYSSATHYVEHLAPVWDALAPGVRGVWMMPADIVDHAAKLGVTGEVPLPVQVRDKVTSLSGYRGTVVDSILGRRDLPVAVASHGDLVSARRWRSRFAFFEHGAGISYGGDPKASRHPSYAGGSDRDGVGLFLVPGRYPAERNRAAHPDIPVVEIGCPKLDRLRALPRLRAERPVVGFAWHWEGRLTPETRSAFPYYAEALRTLGDRWQLLGGSHVRADDVRKHYRHLGIEQATSFADLVARADVLVADNTSAIYEFAAATDRPVVALNAPWYRRDVHHGLRFWEAVPGLQVDHPADLADAITEALADAPALRRMRRAAVAAVYTHNDGTSAARAAAALTEWAA